jgi:hypothetical protein
MKKILLVILTTLTFNANAENKYIYSLDTEGDISIWNNVPLSESSYGKWIDVGEPLDCSSWTPALNTVNNGTSFTQYSDCNQKQTRTITYQQYNKATDQYKTVKIENGYQTASVNITQQATGTKSTGYYSWTIHNVQTLKTLKGVASDYTANRALMVTYLNNTQYKYNYTSVACNSSSVSDLFYYGSISANYSSNPQPGNDQSTVIGSAVTKRCKYVSN